MGSTVVGRSYSPETFLACNRKSGLEKKKTAHLRIPHQLYPTIGPGKSQSYGLKCKDVEKSRNTRVKGAVPPRGRSSPKGYVQSEALQSFPLVQWYESWSQLQLCWCNFLCMCRRRNEGGGKTRKRIRVERWTKGECHCQPCQHQNRQWGGAWRDNRIRLCAWWYGKRRG